MTFLKPFTAQKTKKTNNWEDIVVLQNYKADVDEEDYLPPSSKEWTTSEEDMTQIPRPSAIKNHPRESLTDTTLPTLKEIKEQIPTPKEEVTATPTPREIKAPTTQTEGVTSSTP